MIILDSIQQEERYNFNDEDLNFKLGRLKSGAGNVFSGNLVIPLVTSPIINFELIRNENELPYYVNSVYEDDRKFLSSKNSTNNVKNIEESKIFERMREYQYNQVIEQSSSKISYTRSSNVSASTCKESSKERNVNKDWLIEAPKKAWVWRWWNPKGGNQGFDPSDLLGGNLKGSNQGFDPSSILGGNGSGGPEPKSVPGRGQNQLPKSSSQMTEGAMLTLTQSQWPPDNTIIELELQMSTRVVGMFHVFLYNNLQAVPDEKAKKRDYSSNGK
ncbi:11043_t:CDS:2, partial [Dentiscutata heterogama]